MRSDYNCHGSSESETQRENVVGQVQKPTVLKARPDFIAEDESSDKDELTRKVHDLSLSCTGTVVQQQFSINVGTLFNIG